MNNVQLDLATLALKGQRYQEAESIYSQLAQEENSLEAWVGMGICKLYQISEGRTMDEVIFCFDRAKNLSPAMGEEIDNQLIYHSLVVLKTYSELINAAALKHQEAKKSAQAGALIAGISMVAGLNSKSAFGTIASLSGTGAGVGVAVNSLNKMNDFEALIQTIFDKSNTIYKAVKKSVSSESEYILKFEEATSNLNTYIQTSLKQISNGSNNRKVLKGIPKYLMLNASTLDQLKLMQCYLGIHKFKEGKTLHGLFYLSTFGGFMILGYLDSIKMLNGEYSGVNLLD